MEGGGMTSLTDDLLSEVLLRLPPRPSSLPCASLVCKRWCRIVSDHNFTRRFRSHHRKPPLLGYFASVDGAVAFVPALDPPDRIPSECFSVPVGVPYSPGWQIISCRHGLVLYFMQNWDMAKLLVWDPVTRDRRSIAVPREIENLFILNGAVLCVAADQGHVHGVCCLGSFKVVLLGTNSGFDRLFASVYTSETGIWSDIFSAPISVRDSMRYQSVLIGNSLYWLSDIGAYDAVAIIDFDLDRQHLGKIDVPADIPAEVSSCALLIKPTAGDGLGLLVLSEYICQTWKMKVDCYGVTRWVPWETIELDELFHSKHIPMPDLLELMGFAEDHNVMILWSAIGIFMVQLESKHLTRISATTYLPDLHDCHLFTGLHNCHPFTGFY